MTQPETLFRQAVLAPFALPDDLALDVPGGDPPAVVLPARAAVDALVAAGARRVPWEFGWLAPAWDVTQRYWARAGYQPGLTGVVGPNGLAAYVKGEFDFADGAEGEIASTLDQRRRVDGGDRRGRRRRHRRGNRQRWRPARGWTGRRPSAPR